MQRLPPSEVHRRVRQSPAPSVPPSAEVTAAAVSFRQAKSDLRAQLLEDYLAETGTPSLRERAAMQPGPSSSPLASWSVISGGNLRRPLPCALRVAGYPCLSERCGDNTHVQFQRAMESAAAEKALQGTIIMSEANDPWHVAQVLPSGPVQASHTWGSMDAIPPGGVHYTAGGFSAPAQSQFGGRALPPVDDLTFGRAYLLQPK